MTPRRIQLVFAFDTNAEAELAKAHKRGERPAATCPATARSSSGTWWASWAFSKSSATSVAGAAANMLARLIARYGLDAKLFDWSDEITADCPRKQAKNLNDQCGARCPDLPKVV